MRVSGGDNAHGFDDDGGDDDTDDGGDDDTNDDGGGNDDAMMLTWAHAEIAVSCPGLPETYPKKWMTFCVEGNIEAIEAFLAETGKPLVALLSLREALQVGYPQFVDIVSTQ